MLFSAEGKVVRFSEQAVRSMGRTATGVRGINLQGEDRVVSLIIPRGEGDILTVTQNGFGKRTAVNEYPTKSRATKGLSLSRSANVTVKWLARFRLMPQTRS